MRNKEEIITFRVDPVLLEELNNIIDKNPLLFANVSHFIRSATIREIRRLKNEK